MQRGAGSRGRGIGKRRKLGSSTAGITENEPVVEAAKVCICNEWSEPEARSRAHAEFASAAPYPHIVLRPFLGETALRALRADLEKVNAKEKETDLFRFFQTADLAPRNEDASDTPAVAARPPTSATRKKRRRRQSGEMAANLEARAPTLAALARLFGSDEFRTLCQDVTQCGEMSNRVDLAAQVYPRRGHLLCHDDVIGTRKVSFIYYLTDPEEDWHAAEGGALELYPQEVGAPRGTPSTTPAKELLPLADSLAIFIVEPGVSFHAVRELRGSRARISMQGWLHAPTLELTASFEDRGLATLQQLLEKKVVGKEASVELASGSGDTAEAASTADATGALTEEDTEMLANWLSAEYLDRDQLKAISERFAETSYAVLTTFLRADVAERINSARGSADRADGFAADSPELTVPNYSAGALGGWTTVGPPHLQRFMRYQSASHDHGSVGESDDAHVEPQKNLGNTLQGLAESLFRTVAFRRWLHVCTGLEPRDQGQVDVRRFRPGLDYTVATHVGSAAPQGAELDATIAFVEEASRTSDGATAREVWSSEDVGGFESYLAADDDDEAVEAQETYRGQDDGPLVNLPPTSNALCLVMRDAQTLRFVKYLSRDAPSSRADVTARFAVDAPEGSSEEEVADDKSPPQPATSGASVGERVDCRIDTTTASVSSADRSSDASCVAPSAFVVTVDNPVVAKVSDNDAKNATT